MPSRPIPRTTRRILWIWVACAAASAILLLTPLAFRSTIATALEWTLFFPVRSVLGWGGRSLWIGQENQRLVRQLAEQRLESARFLDAAQENDLLRSMLAMSVRSRLTLTPVRVLGREIDWRGERLRIEPIPEIPTGTAVVCARGLLGWVRAGGSRFTIETLWHQDMAVSAVNARTGEQGILRWNARRPEEMMIDAVPLQGDYRVGDPILTSGLGEVFVHGILVGTILAIEEDPRTQLRRVRVRPAARRGTIREVFLVRERPPGPDGSSLFPLPRPAGEAPHSLPGGPSGRP